MNISSRQNGIYAIFCKVNRFIYIGSSSGKFGFRTRILVHLNQLNNGTHHSRLLQKDFDKYGKDAFSVFILEVCSPKECLDFEQHWVDFIGVGAKNQSYNTCPIPGIAPSPLGRKDRPETIAKRVASNKAKPWSKETKERANQMVGDANALNFIATSPDGQEYEFRNLTAFCREHDLQVTHMHSTANNKAVSHRGWKCRYAHETKEQQVARIQAMPSIANKRTYILTSPDCVEFITDNLEDFCRKHGLSSAALCSVASGSSRMYKNWFCRYSDESEELKQKRLSLKDKNRDYIITTPDYEEMRVHGLTQFCRDRNLDPSSIAKVCRGINSHHKGYKVRYADS